MLSLRIFLFGTFQIDHGANTAAIKMTRTTQALLAYLLLQQQRNQPRELLTELFWREHSPEKAHSCLNTALWRLRNVLEPDGIERGTYLLSSTSSDVSFNWASDHWLDVAAFETQTQRILAKPIQRMEPADAQRLSEALQLCRGELLEGFYEDWALRQREYLRRLQLNSLAHLLHYYKHHSQFEQSLAFGQQILDLDPLREEIHRAMMELYLANGQRSQALHQFERCRGLLKTELEVEPMDETLELYKRISHNRTPQSALPPLAIPPAPDLQCHKQAIQELQQAMTTFDEARRLLQRAIQRIEQWL